MRTLIRMLILILATTAIVAPAAAETGSFCYTPSGYRCMPGPQYCVRDAARCYSSCTLEKTAPKPARKPRRPS